MLNRRDSVTWCINDLNRRGSAEEDFTVLIARTVPSSSDPRALRAACALSSTFEICGISTAKITNTTTTAARVVPNSTRSSWAISTREPMIMIPPLIRPMIDVDAAWFSNTVSEVTRVTSSPGPRESSAKTRAPR